MQVKRGLYYSKDFPPTQYEIANKLYQPSYISLQTAMSMYSIIPEVTYSTTSITTNYTREFNVDNVNFAYRRIKQSAYTGYSKINGHVLATPEKAVCDYLYFVSLGREVLNDRLNLSKVDKREVFEYAKLFNSDSLDRWISQNYD